VISLAKAQFPTVKIVVSEITPRSDDLNAIVEHANTQLRVALNNTDNVFLVSHENVKEKRCVYDNKYFSRTVGIPKLASNLIRGIRLARGLKRRFVQKKPKAKASDKESHRDLASKSEKPINSQEFPPNHEININIIEEVLQQLKVNGSILSGLASSRQYVQGLGTPTFPQTVYPIRQAMSPVF